MPKARAVLIAAQLLSGYLAWYAVRAVAVHTSRTTYRPSADATPLWIPQLCMAIGCVALRWRFWMRSWRGCGGVSGSLRARLGG